ncbi:MAG: four helix bundle protein [bacterium]|nr:four helix bundle protein [bacterium]
MPILQKFIAAYKLWDEFKKSFPKQSRFTIGVKIDVLFLDVIELLFVASRLSKEQKLPYLHKASVKLDLLKFFLQIAWELKAVDTKKYIMLSEQLNEIGKMLGGWIRGLQQKQTPPHKGGGEQSEFRTAANR